MVSPRQHRSSHYRPTYAAARPDDCHKGVNHHSIPSSAASGGMTMCELPTDRSVNLEEEEYSNDADMETTAVKTPRRRGLCRGVGCLKNCTDSADVSSNTYYNKENELVMSQLSVIYNDSTSDHHRVDKCAIPPLDISSITSCESSQVQNNTCAADHPLSSTGIDYNYNFSKSLKENPSGSITNDTFPSSIITYPLSSTGIDDVFTSTRIHETLPKTINNNMQKTISSKTSFDQFLRNVCKTSKRSSTKKSHESRLEGDKVTKTSVDRYKTTASKTRQTAKKSNDNFCDIQRCQMKNKTKRHNQNVQNGNDCGSIDGVVTNNGGSSSRTVKRRRITDDRSIKCVLHNEPPRKKRSKLNPRPLIKDEQFLYNPLSSTQIDRNVNNLSNGQHHMYDLPVQFDCCLSPVARSHEIGTDNAIAIHNSIKSAISANVAAVMDTTIINESNEQGSADVSNCIDSVSFMLAEEVQAIGKAHQDSHVSPPISKQNTQTIRRLEPRPACIGRESNHCVTEFTPGQGVVDLMTRARKKSIGKNLKRFGRIVKHGKCERTMTTLAVL